LSVAGVRCFSYLEARELLIESATDKFLLGAVTFAADLEREKARQRTYDAMQRKARAGYCCGGRLFGFDNVDVLDKNGKRSHVERTINEPEAAVIRRIFEMAAAGYGAKAIAKRLNAEGIQSPRAQRGRSQSWAPSSVHAVLRRETYRGVTIYNRTKKRDKWGVKKQTMRPESEWFTIPTPTLQVVSDELWTAAHDRIQRAREIYMRGPGGGGRPTLANPSKYLLSNLATCGPVRRLAVRPVAEPRPLASEAVLRLRGAPRARHLREPSRRADARRGPRRCRGGPRRHPRRRHRL
jgi:hypothetical protein